MERDAFGSRPSEGTAKRRGLGHTLKSLERTRTEGTTLFNLDKAQDSKGGAPSPPLGGLGRRPVSAANAVEVDLDLEVDFKTQNCHLSQSRFCFKCFLADSKPTLSDVERDAFGSRPSEGTAQRRGLGHTPGSLERTRTEGTTLFNLDKAQDSKGGAPSPPLGGLGRRPVSAANALEVDLDLDLDLDLEVKSKFAIKSKIKLNPITIFKCDDSKHPHRDPTA
ncbi:hypothetical protein GW590_20165 [Rahnella sp. SAP-1]|uniref:Uncharacterized protein n=1 Tax=Rouxiella aceris TaxID=2703884 RepID=A0A848MN25_9GAMM|nr:hypothetical protein [Rouxiella aceris]NMP29165.1 hypothetical protein [Rouxiella aceris]